MSESKAREFLLGRLDRVLRDVNAVPLLSNEIADLMAIIREVDKLAKELEEWKEINKKRSEEMLQRGIDKALLRAENAELKARVEEWAGDFNKLVVSAVELARSKTAILAQAKKLAEALEIEMGNSGTRQAEEALHDWQEFLKKEKV